MHEKGATEERKARSYDDVSDDLSGRVVDESESDLSDGATRASAAENLLDGAVFFLLWKKKQGERKVRRGTSW